MACGIGDGHVTVAGDTLVLRQGRLPPRTLRPLEDGAFFIKDDPLRRVVFERDAAGNVIALKRGSRTVTGAGTTATTAESR